MTHYDPLRRSLSEMSRRVGEGWGYTRERVIGATAFGRAVVESLRTTLADVRAYHDDIDHVNEMFAQMRRSRRREGRAHRAHERDTARAHAAAQRGHPVRKTHRRPARAE